MFDNPKIFAIFLSINLLSGFRSVYGIFVLDISIWGVFFLFFFFNYLGNENQGTKLKLSITSMSILAM